MSNALASLVNSGAIGLAALLGQHSNAQENSVGVIAKLEAYMANPSANSTEISTQAALLVQMFATSNPTAAGTAAEIQANPSLLPSLFNTLETEINQGSTTISGALARVLHSGTAS